jgi:hypothetical protein
LVRDDALDSGEYIFIASGMEICFNTVTFYDDIRNDGKLIVRKALNVYGRLINNGIMEVGW